MADSPLRTPSVEPEQFLLPRHSASVLAFSDTPWGRGYTRNCLTPKSTHLSNFSLVFSSLDTEVASSMRVLTPVKDAPGLVVDPLQSKA
ncbi:hypothetical protein H9L39_10163 [Fusarium oxysporum f. sp. albedinis]|nr:hypothetical protein H9L39_10163 [Fusarium oxysporum f. sp. albedinis]